MPPPTAAGKGEELFQKRNRPVLEGILLRYVRQRRWFRGKARHIQSPEIQDVIPMRFAGSIAYLVLIQVDYTEGEPETYVLPLNLAPVEQMDQIMNEHPHAVIARLKPSGKDGGTETILYDALVDKGFCNALLRVMGRRRRFKGEIGTVLASRTRAFRTVRGPADAALEPAPIKAEQSNTSVVYGDRLILKLFRRLEEGVNPELEIGRFLTEKALFPHISPVAGALECHRRDSKPMSLALLQGFVPNEGDAWQCTLDSLGRYFEHVLVHPTVQVPPVPHKSLLYLLSKEVPSLAQETIGPYLASARLLGERTAELHLALASVPDAPDFAPEPFSVMYQNSIYHSMRSLAIQSLQLLRERLEDLPQGVKEDAQAVLDLEKTIVERFRLIRSRKFNAARIRCHGDYHLGQVLYTGKDFVIIDFEGEPARPLSERRLKRSPLRDVAGMIRSFDYAAHSALLRQASSALRPEDLPVLEQWGRFWYVWVSTAFLASYLMVIEKARLLPEDPEQLKLLLDAYLLEKAVYEIDYELNNRPDWVKVPLQGILQLMEAGE